MESQPTQIIVVDPEGDLTVNLYKLTDDGEQFISGSGAMIDGRILATFQVSKKVLVDNSEQFKSMLQTGFRETNQTTLDTDHGTINSLELCFRIFHDTLVEEMYAIPVEDLWYAIEVCGYRSFDITKLNGWFEEWFNRKNLYTRALKAETETEQLEEMRQLLYPAHEFDNPKAFAFLTKKLAYHVAEHITEDNPTELRFLHLNGHVIGSINGARGSLRSKMLRGIFDPLGLFLTQTCNCKEASLFAYVGGLSRTGIWPLQNHYHKSVQDILDSPGFVKFACKIPDGTCAKCLGMISPMAVQNTRLKLVKDFDGLCLDCMDRSNPKTGDVDTDYWNHDSIRHWDLGCRISHKQPTWYFSFMGRRDEMKAHQLKMKDKRKKEKDLNSRFPAFGFGPYYDSD